MGGFEARKGGKGEMEREGKGESRKVWPLAHKIPDLPVNTV